MRDGGVREGFWVGMSHGKGLLKSDYYGQDASREYFDTAPKSKLVPAR